MKEITGMEVMELMALILININKRGGGGTFNTCQKERKGNKHFHTQKSTIII